MKITHAEWIEGFGESYVETLARKLKSREISSSKYSRLLDKLSEWEMELYNREQ
jgi:hypothetical protein